MKVETAIALIGTLVYKPGWTIEAVDHRHRHEDCIKIQVTYPAKRSERELASRGYPDDIDDGARASFVVLVGDIQEDCELYRRLLDCILSIEEHEAREFLRIKPSYWAPFHPHLIDGMKRWGSPDRDLLFGAA